MNPGNDTRRINGYKIYWDTDSGSGSSYAFNSDTHPGQVSFSGTTATVSGLQSGTTYYFTVTSKSNYTDPSSNITTTYESILYPTQVSGDPSFVYPVEVQATTDQPTCIPTAEVTGLTVNKSGAQYQLCWNAVTDHAFRGTMSSGPTPPRRRPASRSSDRLGRAPLVGPAARPRLRLAPRQARQVQQVQQVQPALEAQQARLDLGSLRTPPEPMQTAATMPLLIYT